MSSGNRYDLGRGLVIVAADAEGEVEAEFNSWYDDEHFPERAALDGVLWGQRYRLVDGGGARFLTVYGLQDLDVLKGEQYAALPDSPRTAKLLPQLRNLTRRVYESVPPSVFAK